jgi:SAM-dependent methyltransferase
MGLIRDEAAKLVRTPLRWRELLRPRRWRQFFGILWFRARSGNRWKTSADPHFQQRDYASYDQYLQHQQSKLQYLDLAEYDRRFHAALKTRLAALAQLRAGQRVLCLGARQGTEVRAFRDLGCDAIGLDLNPGFDNPHVIQGDFHNLQFPPQSMDIIFTNSLDHVFDIAKVLSEIARVLKPGGLLIVEAMLGGAHETTPDSYASFWWGSPDDLIALFAKHGFAVAQRTPFTEPWPGEQICYIRKP